MVKDSVVTVRTRKFMTNRLLNRKQFVTLNFNLIKYFQVVDINHSGRTSLPKEEVKKRLVNLYKVNDPNTVFVFGFQTKFGGGKSSGFGLIYDDVADAKRFEPQYRLIRQKLATAVEKSRKQIKEKNQLGNLLEGILPEENLLKETYQREDF